MNIKSGLTKSVYHNTYKEPTYSWKTIGSAGFSSVASDYVQTEIAANSSGNVFVAFQESSTSQLSVMMWNGTVWAYLGAAGSASDANVIIGDCMSMAVSPATGYPVVVYRDQSNPFRLSMRRWDGAAWAYVGIRHGASEGGAGGAPGVDIECDASGNPFFAYIDNNTLSVRRWTGSAWAYVGSRSQLASSDVNYVALAKNPSTSRVVVSYTQDILGGGKPYFAWWNGSAWTKSVSGANNGAPGRGYDIHDGLDGKLYMISASSNPAYRYDPTTSSWSTFTNGSVFGVSSVVQARSCMRSNGDIITCFENDTARSRFWNGTIWANFPDATGNPLSAGTARVVAVCSDANDQIFAVWRDVSTGKMSVKGYTIG